MEADNWLMAGSFSAHSLGKPGERRSRLDHLQMLRTGGRKDTGASGDSRPLWLDQERLEERPWGPAGRVGRGQIRVQEGLGRTLSFI